jgi:cytochrome c peroxidase
MRRFPGLLVPIVLAAPMLARGASGEEGPQAVKSQLPRTKAQRPPGSETLKSEVTPLNAVDPRQLTDVVAAEVKGGEAHFGPTPADFLWQPPQVEPAKSEEFIPEPPAGLPRLIPNATIPSANPMTKAKVELGKQLYFDPRVSKDGTVSCATCHNPEKGWTDGRAHSTGINGLTGTRSAPTVLNTAFGRSLFWDGRAPSLEGQAQGPIQNPIEMGDQSYKQIIERLRKIPGYRDQFRKVFGTDVTLDAMAKAIAAFERTVFSGDSPYDHYIQGDQSTLTESQKRGMVLFGLRLNEDDDFKTDATLKKANCTSCHVGFNFTDEQFHNLGVGWNEKTRRFADLGRWAVAPIGAKNPADIGAFKTPTLRDITRTAPYMHDGSEKTLEEVVEFYDRGGNANPYLDKDMKKLNLTAQEKADVVAFLKALASPEYQVELPKLPPGPDGKAPNPRAALEPPARRTALDVFHPGIVR